MTSWCCGCQVIILKYNSAIIYVVVTHVVLTQWKAESRDGDLLHLHVHQVIIDHQDIVCILKSLNTVSL